MSSRFCILNISYSFDVIMAATLKDTDDINMPSFLQNFTKVATLAAHGGFIKFFTYKVRISKSVYDLQHFFCFLLNFFYITKKGV